MVILTKNSCSLNYVQKFLINECVLFCHIKAFYSKFYVPEKDSFPSEVETTDKLARSIVVIKLVYTCLIH